VLPDDESPAEEETEEGEEEFYLQAPEPAFLSDPEGQVMIPDPLEFCEKYNADAVQLWNGKLSVLDRDSRQWSEVGAHPSKAKLRPVQ
jgi:hypothetical protein